MYRKVHRAWHRSTLRYYQRSASTLARFILDKARYRRTPLPSIFRASTPLCVVQPANNVPDATCAGAIPPIIWLYWHQGPPTEIVRLVQRQLQTLNPQHEVRLVCRESITEWLPDFRPPSEAISVQHFSDILRLDLLYRYGGVWCDASLVFFVSLEAIFNGKLAAASNPFDLMAFYIERFSSRLDPPIIENWFIAAPPASPVIQAWREALEPMREGGEGVFSDYLKSLPDYAALKQNMLMEEYLVSHIALQSALAGMDRYALCLERAEDESFALQVASDWRPYDLIRQLLAQPSDGASPRLVKLSGYDRHLADLVLRRRLENPNSLLGRLSTQGRNT